MRKLYLIAACVSLATAGQRPIVKQMSIPVPMRDGVRLLSNLYLPFDRGQFPCILVRTPYGKGLDITAHYQAFVDRGYAVMVQDVRGRYESEGAFQPLTQEPADGDDKPAAADGDADDASQGSDDGTKSEGASQAKPRSR